MGALITDSDLKRTITLPGTYNFSSAVPSAAHNTIPYCIADDPMMLGEFKNGPGGNGQASFYCRWEDANTLGGYLLSANNQNVGGYTIRLGLSHPIYANYYCASVKVSPVAGNVTDITWRWAKIDCEYEPHEWEGNGALIKRQAITPSGIQMSIPNFNPAGTYGGSGSGAGSAADSSGYTWNNGQAMNNVLLTPPEQSIYIPYKRYSLTIFNVVTLDLATIDSLTNHLNTAPMAINLGPTSTYNASTGTALYEGISETEKTIAFDGVGRWNVTHQWLIGPIDQNMVPNWDLFNRGITNFLDIYVMPDQKTYKYGDFSTLGILGA